MVKGTNYDNVWYDVVLKTIRNKINTDISGVKVYIAPTILYPDNYQIRLWGSQTETHDHGLDYWNKVYTTNISLYMIDQNHTEKTYEQFYNDVEKLYQVLHKNTTMTGTTSGNTFTILNGLTEEIVINEFDEVEEQIEGLMSANLTHTSLVERAQ